MFDERLPVLAEMADNAKARASDRIRALEVLGRVGLDASINVDDVRRCVEAQYEAINEILPPDLAHRLIERLKLIWR